MNKQNKTIKKTEEQTEAAAAPEVQTVTVPELMQKIAQMSESIGRVSMPAQAHNDVQAVIRAFFPTK